MPNDTQFLKALLAKGADGTIEFVASDETVDRSGESIPLESWDLSNFLKSPRLLVDHDYRVESIVGVAENTRVEKNALRFTPRFHDITDLSREVKAMVEQGVLDTVSVGFLRRIDGEKSTNELMEISFVAVPANPNARMLAVKSLEGAQMEAVEEWMRGKGSIAQTVKTEPEAAPVEPAPEAPTPDVPAPELVADPQPEAQPEAEKGLIEDTLEASEDMRRTKCAYADMIWNAMCDAMAAYFSDAVKVEDIATIGKELADKIMAISAGPAMEPMAPEVVLDGFAKYAVLRGMEVTDATKAGRVLSEKNRAIIQAAVDAMKSASGALDDLMAATEADKSAGIEPSKTAPSPVSDELDKFVELRGVVRSVATVLSEALADAKLKRGERRKG